METAARNNAEAIVAIVIGVLTATIPTCLLFQAVTYLFVVPLALGVPSISFGVAALQRSSALGIVAAGMSLVLLVVAIAVPYGLIAYHNRTGYPIVLVIRDNYRGPVRLVLDRERGVVVPLRGGVYEYRIPADGRLLIRDDEPFSQWHTITAVYAGGGQIPTDHEGNLPPDMILLHSLGSGVRTRNGTTEEYIKFFVGPKAELRKYIDRH